MGFNALALSVLPRGGRELAWMARAKLCAAGDNYGHLGITHVANQQPRAGDNR